MPLHAQATFGQTSGSFASNDNSGVNTDNEIATSPAFSVPFAGRIANLSADVGGNGAAVNGRLIGWDTSDLTPDAKSAQFSFPSGRALRNANTDGHGRVVGLGRQYWLGWWRDPGGSSIWDVTGSGSFFRLSNTGSDVGNLSGATGCGAPYTCGQIQAYAVMVGVPPHVDYHFAGMAMRAKRL